MIVRMKKITMVVPDKYKEELLLCLRKEGVVHIKHLTRPSGQEITSLEGEDLQVKKAIAILSEFPPCRPQGTVGQLDEGGIFNKAERILSAQQRREELRGNIRDTQNGMAWYMPWGEFVPGDLSELRKRNIYIKLYRLDKGEFRKIQDRGNFYLIKKDRGYFYAACISYGQALCSPLGEVREQPFEEIKLPSESCEGLKRKLALYNKELNEVEEFLREQVIFKGQFSDFSQNLQTRHRFLEVFYGMGSKEGFSVLQGFCPLPEVGKVTSLARKQGFGYLLEEPDNEEETPTFIKNPKWISIINPVFDFMKTLPGYNEFDISMVFLIFFSLFFAMLIGDAGYGLLFLGGTWLIRRKTRQLPPQLFYLLYLLSGATIIWGALTGTWFGVEEIARIPVLNALIIERINSFVDNENFMIYLCFIIGVIHLTIAHIMRCVKWINSLKALAQLGWIATLWGLFFVAGTLVVNKPFPRVAGYLLVSGITLVLVFSRPQRNILKGILSSLVDIPLSVISSFSDIVSYLRLFAVGYATVIMAVSFNSMAMNMGFSSIFRGLGAAAILLLGHTLNITLGLMAIIVHGIRLNMLEFSGHLNMQWSGREYAPFSED